MSNGFLISTFQLFYFSRYQGCPKFTLGGPTPPGRPQRTIFLPISNRVFNFNILALVVLSFQGVPNLRQGALCPLYAPLGTHFSTRGEYFTMSDGVFNFKFLALVFSEILGVPNLHQGALRPLYAPYRRNFFTQTSTSQRLIVFLISTFQLQQFPRFQGDPKFTLRGPVPLCAPPSGKIFVPEWSTLLFQWCFQVQLSSSCIFRDISGSHIYTRGPYAPWTPLAENFFYTKRVLHNI